MKKTLCFSKKTQRFFCRNPVSFKYMNSTYFFGDNIFVALKRRINWNSNILNLSNNHYYFCLITQKNSTCFFIVCCISKIKGKHQNVCDSGKFYQRLCLPHFYGFVFCMFQREALWNKEKSYLLNFESSFHSWDN